MLIKILAGGKKTGNSRACKAVKLVEITVPLSRNTVANVPDIRLECESGKFTADGAKMANSTVFLGVSDIMANGALQSLLRGSSDRRTNCESFAVAMSRLSGVRDKKDKADVKPALSSKKAAA